MEKPHEVGGINQQETRSFEAVELAPFIGKGGHNEHHGAAQHEKEVHPAHSVHGKRMDDGGSSQDKEEVGNVGTEDIA